jgi:Fe-S cluster assembly protein SufD
MAVPTDLTYPGEGLIETFAARGEPDWLVGARRKALRAFNSAPDPTNRDERWRYTKLERFSLEGCRSVEESADPTLSARIRQRISDTDANGVLVHKGGKVVFQEASPLGEGVIFKDLLQALLDHPELVQSYLGSVLDPSQGKYVALNTALWGSGTFVYVPKNVELEIPLGAFTTADQGGFGAGRTLIVVDSNAKLTYLDEYTSETSEDRLFHSSVTEIVLLEGAKLRYVSLQDWGRNVAHMNNLRAHLSRDSRLESLNVNLGADAARDEVETCLYGSGAESEILGLYFADRGQHFNQYTLQHHLAEQAHSDLLFMGALRDGSTEVYSGVIVVDEGAQQTNAYQMNRNLLLDDKSQAVSIPQLEIAANDVRCSHGSTCGPVSEDQRFYLMSRGLAPEVAEHLLVTGFLNEVLSRVTLPGAASYVERMVQEKLGVPGVQERPG